MTLDIPGPAGTWLPTWRLLKEPTAYYQGLREEYGDPFLVHAINGDVVLTGDPVGVREIFSAPPKTYAAFGVEAARALVGDRSLFLLEGRPHKRARRLLMPPFHGKRMRTYAEIIDAVTRREVERLTPGQELLGNDLGLRISFEVILRAVFGLTSEVDTYAKALHDLLDAARPELLFFRGLQRAPFGFGPWGKFLRRREHVEEMLQAQIERSRAATPGEDILSLLLGARDEDGVALEDAEVRDELITLLFAGHETTAITLAWALHHLHHHPEALARVRQELAQEERPFLKAAIKETMRLHPIVPDNIRVLREDFTLLGRTIPAGHCVGAAACLVHNDPDIYPEPSAFRPERFLERAPSPFEYFPFGGGHRRCIGAAFATFEIEIVLARLLRECTFRALDPIDLGAIRRSVTMGPSTGVRLRVGEPPNAAENAP